MKLYTLVDGEYVEVELGCFTVECSEEYGSIVVTYDIDRVDDGSTLTTIEREV